MSASPVPFATARKRAQRARIAADFHDGGFLHARVGGELAARLGGVNRTFAHGLVWGAAGHFAPPPDRVEALWPGDSVATLAPGGAAFDPEHSPLADGAFDLLVHVLGLHWSNDLPGALIQVRRALKPDGLFLAAMFGGRTLEQLRGCLLDAELALTGGAAMRVAPFADLGDMAGLMQRAGFTLPVVDTDVVTVRYATPLRLLADLRAMGETAALAGATPRLRRDVLARAMALYEARFAGADGKVPATFEILYLHGWAAHDSQQKPLRPGSAKMRLAEALGVPERSAGEKAGG
jgi:SAM-dependent methyltransferase